VTKKELLKLDKYYSKYGITYGGYCSRFEYQGFKCALCGREPKKGQRRYPVDHNHKTGRRRAIVCFYCNKYRIGRHDLASAKALYEYMMKYDG